MFKHLKEKKISYLKHFMFAASVSWRLSVSSLFFILHAILPIIAIPYNYNLESMALYLFEKNNDLEN
tara:strand:- start:1050 stop:1250 length:201 start_codon:yes stop_codon:yes gene_type:complete